MLDQETRMRRKRIRLARRNIPTGAKPRKRLRIYVFQDGGMGIETPGHGFG
jgi:hypothetical protein